MNVNYCAPMVVCYDNDNTAIIPEVWAMESLMILEENQVMARLVNRNYENSVSAFGDVVNVHRPAIRRARRRTDSDNYVAKAAVTDKIQVPLNQYFYDSFLIKDGEQSKAFVDVVNLHIRPAMNTIARAVDRSVLGFAAHKLIKTPTARSGRLNNLNSTTGQAAVTEMNLLMHTQLAPEDGRRLVLSPAAEAGLLQVDNFIRQDANGENGALKNARLGRIFGFQTYMSQNVPYCVKDGADTVAGTITSGLAAGGSGSQACTIANYEVVNGEYAVVAGNDQPTYITANTASTNTTAITLNEANKYATESSAVVTVYKACDVHKASGNYTVGWSDDIIVDGHAANKGPKAGQLISFGTTTRHTYVIVEAEAISSTSTSLLLDRPLEVQVDNDHKAFPGPAGSFCPAFHQDCIALVTRPLAAPPSQFGAMGISQSYKDVSMRLTFQYDAEAGGTRVNFDILAGLALLDENLGTLLLG